MNKDKKGSTDRLVFDKIIYVVEKELYFKKILRKY